MRACSLRLWQLCAALTVHRSGQSRGAGALTCGIRSQCAGQVQAVGTSESACHGRPLAPCLAAWGMLLCDAAALHAACGWREVVSEAAGAPKNRCQALKVSSPSAHETEADPGPHQPWLNAPVQV